MTTVLKSRMKLLVSILFLAVAFSGCTTRSKARAEAHDAYLAGQRDALAVVARTQRTGVVVNGPVQNSEVPWVEGLTLAQAIATANYTASGTPKTITITRGGESAVVKPQDLLRGADVPLEPGDTVTLH